MTWHALDAVDATFFDTAPFVYRYPVDLGVPPARVWDSISSERSLGAWGLGVRLRWTSPPPFDIGATREVVLPLRAMSFRERFFRWDAGEGYSFFVEEANRPIFTRFAENYEIEKTATGSRFTWTIAYETRPRFTALLRLTSPLNRLAYSATPRAGRRYFRKHP